MDDKLAQVLTQDQMTELSLARIKGVEAVDKFWTEWAADVHEVIDPTTLATLVEAGQIKPFLFWRFVFGSKLMMQFCRSFRRPMSKEFKGPCKLRSYNFILGDSIVCADEIRLVGFSKPTLFRGYYTLVIDSVEKFSDVGSITHRIMLTMDEDCDVTSLEDIVVFDDDDPFFIRMIEKWILIGNGIHIKETKND